MNRLAIVVLVIAGGAFGVWAWAQKAVTDNTYRYRLTVTVEADGKAYSGSSVVQVSVDRTLHVTNSVHLGVTGEAVLVAAAGRRSIFVLLKAPNDDLWSALLPFQLFHDRLPDPVQGFHSEENVRALIELRASAEVPSTLYPMVVAFRDETKPETVFELSPDDLSAALGTRSRVVRVTIETTDDRPTKGALDHNLPWLQNLKTNLAGRNSASTADLAENLTARQFVRNGE